MPTRLMELDAAADGHLVLARHDLGGREIDRIETRGAEAVDLNARHLIAVTCDKCCRARDVAAGFAHRVDAAEHHVIDQFRIETVALFERAERLGGEIERGDFVQGAVRLAAPARRAHVVVDEGVGHFDPSNLSAVVPAKAGTQ